MRLNAYGVEYKLHWSQCVRVIAHSATSIPTSMLSCFGSLNLELEISLRQLLPSIIMSSHFGHWPGAPLGAGFVVQPTNTLKLGDKFPNALVVRVPLTDIPKEAGSQQNDQFQTTLKLYRSGSDEQAPSRLQTDSPMLWKWKQDVPQDIRARFPEPNSGSIFFMMNNVRVTKPGVYHLRMDIRWTKVNGDLIGSKSYASKTFNISASPQCVSSYTGKLANLRAAFYFF